VYFSSPDTWSFTVHSLNEFSDWVLPGVFAYDGQLSTQVNGSLWSLRYEALSYIFLLTVWTICRSASLATLVVVAVAVGTWTSPLVTASVLGIAFTLPFFAGGVLMHWVHARYGTNWPLAVLSAALFVVAAAFGREVYAFAILGAYLVVFLGERQNPGSRLAGKTGDCSYGIYLYGWPAEQIIKQFTGTTSPFLLFFGALAIAWGLAFLSCHLVENPAMKCRRDLAGWMRAGFGRLFNGALAPAIVGAKIAFVAGAVFVLTVGHWWLFLQSMAELLLVTMAGALIAVGAHHVGTGAGFRQTLSRRGGVPRETDEVRIHKSDELQSDKP
jgi:peptidoglycan/LPS O-acetylase OafA/YrhL